MWDKLLHIDRRFIYLVLLAVVLVPLLLQWKLQPGYINPNTQALYDYIENLPAGTPVMVAFDFDPSVSPELLPMAYALTRHLMKKNLRLVGMTFLPGGILLSQDVMDKCAKEYGKQYGVDYVNLGTKPGGSAVLLGMGENLKRVFVTDWKQDPTATMPVLQGVHDFKEIGLVVDITGSGMWSSWLAFAHQRFHVPMAAGVTSVVAMDAYPYLRTGQLVGLINGIAGASEYERLIGVPDQGTLGMPGVTAAHLVMVLFVLIGNIAYFANRRRAQALPHQPPEPPTGEEV
jgi:hypothetical protein